MRRLALSGITTLALAYAAPAAAQHTVRIDFSEYASATTTEHPATVGVPVTSKGLDFYETQYWNGNSSRNVFATWGSDPSDPGSVNRPVNIGSSTTLFATSTAGLEIDMYAAGSDFVTGRFRPAFSLFSMDVGHLYSTEYAPFTLGTINLTFSGFGPGTGGATISQTFSIPAPPTVGSFQYPVLSTLTFDARWRGLNNVWWFQSTGSGTAHQFTNVVAQVAPEPGTYVLMLTGLAGIGLTALRRRRAS